MSGALRLVTFEVPSQEMEPFINRLRQQGHDVTVQPTAEMTLPPDADCLLVLHQLPGVDVLESWRQTGRPVLVLPETLSHEKRTRAEAEAALQRFRVLHNLTSGRPSPRSWQALLDDQVHSIRVTLAAATALLWLVDDGGQSLTLQAQDYADAGGAGPVSAALAQQAFTHNKNIVPDEATQGAAGLMRVDSEVIGVLELWPAPGQRFNADDLRFLGLFADRAASAIDNARLFEKVRFSRERLQNLSKRLLEAQEAERHRLARELHDEIGQALTALKINLQTVEHQVSTAAVQTILNDSIGLIETTLQQVRSLSLDLRPSHLDHLGLPAALRLHLRRLAGRAGFSEHFHAEPAEMNLPASVATACFRVAQEALTNVVRHAQARQVTVEVRQRTNELQLRVSDDGIGFDVAKARLRAARGESLGLLGMQERVLLVGGSIDIQSTTGQGTTIHASLPLDAEHAMERRRKRRPGG